MTDTHRRDDGMNPSINHGLAGDGMMVRLASLSEDGVYRYDLTRRWDTGGAVLWIMLNPSTADAEIDDPTIRRCIGFTKRMMYGALVVVNLYALRATDPKELRRAADPVGPENDETIERQLSRCDFAIAAWGASLPNKVPSNVERMAGEAGKRLYCLGKTKHGSPRHPLYVAGNQPLSLFWPHESIEAGQVSPRPTPIDTDQFRTAPLHAPDPLWPERTGTAVG